MNTPADITDTTWDIYNRIPSDRTEAETRAAILEGMDQADAVPIVVAAHPEACAWKRVQVDGVTVGWTFQTAFGKRAHIRYGAILRGADAVLSVSDGIDQAADDVRAGAAAAGTLDAVAAAAVLEDAAPAAEAETVASSPAPDVDLPAGVTVVVVPTAFRDWFAVDCIRHTGHAVKVAGDFPTRDEAVAVAWDHWEAEHREADDALTLEEIDRAVELASELSEAQYGALWTAHTGDVLEDAQGFFTYSHTTDAPVKLSRDRIVRLVFAGYLAAYPEGEHRRTFRLTPKGDRARRLLFRARRKNVVELAAKDGGLGVPAAKLRRYPALADGHPVRAKLLPESPAKGCATPSASVVFNATEHTNRKDPATMSTATLTQAQADAVAVMKRNGGWAKKGDKVNRRTFSALVDKGLATWTINVPGGHWAGYLNGTDAQAGHEKSAPKLELAARVREHYPSANSFRTVEHDGQDAGATFATAPLPTGKYGWALADGTVGPRLYLTQAEAEASMRRRIAQDQDQAAADNTTVEIYYTGTGDPIVHAAGCAHNDRKRHQGTETMTVSSLEELAGHVYADQINEDPSGTAASYTVYLHVKPCARHIPDTTPTATEAPATEAPVLADPVTEFAAVIAATDADDAPATEDADHNAIPDDAYLAIARTFPDAHDFQRVDAEDGTFLGHTFQVGKLHAARWGWVTAAGTYGKSLEPYRSHAAAMLPVQVADDQRTAAMRTVRGTHPNASGFRPFDDSTGVTIGWTFRTGRTGDVRETWGWVLTDGTVNSTCPSKEAAERGARAVIGRRALHAAHDAIEAAAEAKYPDANGFRALSDASGIVGWTFRTGHGAGAQFSWVLNDHTVGATPWSFRDNAASEAQEHAAAHPQTPQVVTDALHTYRGTRAGQNAPATV